MEKIIITGFEPFGEDNVNSSWEAVRRLPGNIRGAEILKRCLPVEYRRSWEMLREAVLDARPGAVVCVGQASGRTCVTPEKIAVNWQCGKIPDNAGITASGGRILEEGADAYFSSLFPEKITAALIENHIPAQISYTAGAYVCNCLFYNLMHFLKSENSQTIGGFIHVPCCTSQALARPERPSMPTDMTAAGLETAAVCIISSMRGEL